MSIGSWDKRLRLGHAQVGRHRVPAAFRAVADGGGGAHRGPGRGHGRQPEAEHPEPHGPHLDDGGRRRSERDLRRHGWRPGLCGRAGQLCRVQRRAQCTGMALESSLRAHMSGVWRMEGCHSGFSAVGGLRLADEPGKYADNRGVPTHRSTSTRSFFLCNLADNVKRENLGGHAKLGSYACTDAPSTRMFRMHNQGRRYMAT